MTQERETDRTHSDVQHYYGEILQSSSDLKTSACCNIESVPKAHRALLQKIHPEILDKFYGCGSPIPFALEGRTVLDLGCGTGRDSYLLSALVGPNGQVVGVDMTEAQLAVARRHVDFQTQAFGYQRPNVQFLQGQIEDLAALGIADGSIDVVVSNCVINLSPHKERVFKEIFRVLKPGGELYFSDIFAGCRIPKDLTEDAVLIGECLSGAMYREDFRRLLAKVGFADFRAVFSQPLALHNEEIEARIGMIPFWSETVRTFKLDLEDRCENYGHVAWYLGGIQEAPHAFALDDHHLFQKGLPVPVCANTAAMLRDTRLGPYFRVEGSMDVHYGLFPCGPSAQPSAVSAVSCC